MTQRPESSTSTMGRDAEVDLDTRSRPDPSAPIAPDSDLPSWRGDEFDSLVEGIRSWLGWDRSAVKSLADRIRRRLGVAPMSPGAVALFALVGVGVRLACVIVATALAGAWDGAPWVGWAVILAFYAYWDGSTPYIGPPPDVAAGPRVKQIMEGWTALLPSVAHESDLRDLAGNVRRWHRPLVSTATGVAVAAIMFTIGWLMAPNALGELPAGTIVLLAWLLFDFGVGPIYYGILMWLAFMAREARYEHDLFWPSPADSPAVKKAMRHVVTQGSAAGLWITVFLVLTVVLVSWDSPLLVPLGGGFLLIGYLALFGAALSNRASVQKIVQRVRDGRLLGLQERIDGFGPNYTGLSPQESQELRELLFLHDKIRDAPTTPTSTRTVAHTAIGLIIPTILFLATVFGEVYAERFLDTILP